MLSKILHWSPRVLSIAFILFLSLFSLDVFEEYRGFQAFLPFLIHLLPSLVLLLAVILSWKRDLIGAAVFLAFAVAYVLMVGFHRPWSWYAFISGPAALTGILFLLSWIRSHSINKHEQ